MATYDLRDSVSHSGLETWGDEFAESGIAKAPSRLVRPPRVADSPVSMECAVHSIIRVANEHRGEAAGGPHFVGNSDIVIGRVLGIHVKGEYITGDGLFDVLKAMPLARNGYWQYTHISQVWDMEPEILPDDKVSAFALGGNVAVEGENGKGVKDGEEKEGVDGVNGGEVVKG